MSKHPIINREAMDREFGKESWRINTVPNIIVEESSENLRLILDTLGRKGMATKHPHQIRELGGEVLPDYRSTIDIRGWMVDEFQEYMIDHHGWYHVDLYLTIIVDSDASVEVLTGFYNSLSDAPHPPGMGPELNPDNAIPFAIEQIEHLRWAYIPVDWEGDIALFVAEPSRSEYIDLLMSAFEERKIPFARMVEKNGEDFCELHEIYERPRKRELTMKSLSAAEQIDRVTSKKYLKPKLSSMCPPSLVVEIDRWRKFGGLDLSHLQLESLPEGIDQLTSLMRLNLRGNFLASLPPEIGKLRNLRELDLGDNELISLPPEILKLPILQRLDLSGNKFQSLPPEILELPNLQWLDLSGVPIKAAPVEFFELINLRRLYLCDTRLSVLPAEIGKLAKLRRLDISWNELKSLPAEIGRLIHLEALDISHNRILCLPKAICQLSNLEDLQPHRNPLGSPPGEIANKGMTAIREWFRKRSE